MNLKVDMIAGCRKIRAGNCHSPTASRSIAPRLGRRARPKTASSDRLLQLLHRLCERLQLQARLVPVFSILYLLLLHLNDIPALP